MSLPYTKGKDTPRQGPLRGRHVKFIWHYEFDPEDAEKVSEKNRELDEKMKRHPEKYPRLHPSYMTGLCRGFRVVEANSEEQLIHLVMHFYPEERWRLEPIFEGAFVSRVWHAPGFRY
jgi:hypothetical protein